MIEWLLYAEMANPPKIVQLISDRASLRSQTG
jgi:hypothetical protein